MSEFRPPSTHEVDDPDYNWLFDVGITRVEGQMGRALQALYIDNWSYIARAPGSSGNHQAWPGGYLDHIRQFNSFVEQQFRIMDEELVINRLPEEERFTLGQALTVGALHDIEKPFIYTPTEAGHFVRDPQFKDREAKAKFRNDLISHYGIELTPNQQNAMLYVEGIPTNVYTPEERLMSPLAALVHMADVYSARICYGMR